MASKKKMKRPNKICAAGIAWAKRTFDRYPSQTWPLLNIVKTLTMPKAQKVKSPSAKGKSNGRVKEMGETKLGAYWN